MATTNPRRKSKDATPQQTLPFNKSFVAEYRQRMKGDPDPEAQFAYAKYLIEAAKKVHDPADGPKQQRKYRDTLLSESLKLIKRLATTGMGLGKPPFAEAQFFLANCFGNGSLGLQVDHEKAYNLYVQASKQNHPAATYRTAVCNEVGAGTRRDHHRAVLFYRKASALGDTAGMYKLGMVLLNGMLGQARNVREAIVWLKRARRRRTKTTRMHCTSSACYTKSPLTGWCCTTRRTPENCLRRPRNWATRHRSSNSGRPTSTDT